MVDLTSKWMLGNKNYGGKFFLKAAIWVSDKDMGG